MSFTPIWCNACVKCGSEDWTWDSFLGKNNTDWLFNIISLVSCLCILNLFPDERVVWDYPTFFVSYRQNIVLSLQVEKHKLLINGWIFSRAAWSWKNWWMPRKHHKTDSPNKMGTLCALIRKTSYTTNSVPSGEEMWIIHNRIMNYSGRGFHDFLICFCCFLNVSGVSCVLLCWKRIDRHALLFLAS